ncbi:MAG: ferrous iron transport protein A [Opitutaceae bacterium]|jgi:ferrous iron transport protein A|nr:ferrous iron transport protein A [Opitutaceae bacterium]
MSQPATANVRPLAGLPVGSRATIASFDLPDDTHQRLLEMGLLPGAECRVERYAPLGDPLEIKVRGFRLSLRASEAAGIRVAPLA